MRNHFSRGWLNGNPGPYLSLLVPAVILLAVLTWAWEAKGEVLRIPEDYEVGMAQYWLRQGTPPIKGKVQSGTLDTETMELRVDVMIAPGKFETIVLKIVGKGNNPRRKK